MTSPDSPICEARNIGVVFAGRPAIEDVSLAIVPNEVVAILGPSGCMPACAPRRSDSADDRRSLRAWQRSPVSIPASRSSSKSCSSLADGAGKHPGGAEWIESGCTDCCPRPHRQVHRHGRPRRVGRSVSQGSSGGMKTRAGIARGAVRARNFSVWMSPSVPWMFSPPRACAVKFTGSGRTREETRRQWKWQRHSQRHRTAQHPDDHAHH